MGQTAQTERWINHIIDEVGSQDLYGPGFDISYSFRGGHWHAKVYNDIGGGMGHPSDKRYIARANGDTLPEAVQNLVIELNGQLASGADSDD